MSPTGGGEDSDIDSAQISLNDAQQALLNHRPSFRIQHEAYDSGKALVQPIENGAKQVNVDEYRVRIEQLPEIEGQRDPEAFMRHLRRHFGDFLNHRDAEFGAHSPNTNRTWESTDPDGAVMVFDLNRNEIASVEDVVENKLLNKIDDGIANVDRRFALDKAPVVCSDAGPLGWTFSAAWTPEDGMHPVSGHRRWQYEPREDEPDVFRVLGVARIANLEMWALQYTDTAAGAVLPFGVDPSFTDNFAPEIFHAAEQTWDHFVDNLVEFVESNGGMAQNVQQNAWRDGWGSIKRRYFSPHGEWLNARGPLPVVTIPDVQPRDTVTLDASRSKPTGSEIKTIEWDVEMGTDQLATGTGEELSVIFPRTGNYYVHLTVTDRDEKSNTLNLTVSV